MNEDNVMRLNPTSFLPRLSIHPIKYISVNTSLKKNMFALTTDGVKSIIYFILGGGAANEWITKHSHLTMSEGEHGLTVIATVSGTEE